jgi:hypothetical protein
MKNLNLKAFIYILLIFSAILWFALAFFGGLSLSNLWAFLRLLPKVATLDLLLWSLFAKWGWRWRIFRGWLVPFPNLGGTWQGDIRSNWIDKQADTKPAAIPAILSIKQTFGKISCVLRTAEMVSHSYVEGFAIDRDRQLKQLTFSYTSRPKPSVRERSSPHDGTIVFDLIGKPVSKLEGRYWTDRETTGEINLTFRGKEVLEEIPDQFPAHPVSGKNRQ